MSGVTREIKTKITLDGEAEFSREMKASATSAKSLKSEMALVTSEFVGNANSIDALTAKHDVLSRQVDTQQTKVDSLSRMLREASAAYGENSDEAEKYRVKLNYAQADLNKLNAELEQNDKYLDEAKNSSDGCAVSIDKYGKKVKQAGEESESAGSKFSAVAGILGSLATAAAAGVASMASAGVDLAKQLANMTVEGAAYADTVITMSAQTGIAKDKLQGYIYAAELVDVSVETLTKSMAKQIKSMGSYQDGTALTVEAYNKLGVAVTNADGSLRSGEAVYWEVIDALGQMANETERDEVAMQLLGKSAQELNPIILQGSAVMGDFVDEARAAGAVLSDDMLDAYGSFDDALQRLSSSSSAAKNALGTALLPVLTQLGGDGVDLLQSFTNKILECNGDMGQMGEVFGETLNDLVDKLSEYAPQLLDLMTSALGGLGQGILDNLPDMIDTGAQVLDQLVSGLVGGLPRLADGATQILTALLSGIISALPQLTAGGVQMVAQLISGIASALPTLIPAATQCVTELVLAIVDNAPLLISAALALISGLADGATDAIPVLLAAVPDIIDSLVSSILGSIPELVETGVELLTAIVDDLPTIISTIVSMLPQVISSITAALIAHIPDIVDAGVSLLIAIVQDAPAIIAGVVSIIPDVISAIVEAIGGGLGSIIEAGKNLVMGLFNGMEDATQWLYDKLSSWVTGVIDYLKGLFGIKSPAKRLWDEIGYPMGQGVGEGFINAMGDMAGDMADSIPTDFDVDPSITSLAVANGTSALMGSHVRAPSAGSGVTERVLGGVAGAINELSMSQGNSVSGDLIIKLVMPTGEVISRAIIKDFRRVSAASPEPQGDY